MSIKIKSVFSKEFALYGKVLTGYDTKELCAKLDECTPLPTDSVVYAGGITS